MKRNSSSLLDQVAETAAAIRERSSAPPEVAVILGSGLGRLAEGVQVECELPYAEAPHFPRTTAAGHAGRLVLGKLEGRRAIVMQGRWHAYEGHPAWRVAMPVRVFHALGAKTLVVTNASGGLNPLFRGGDVMLLSDHINLMFRSPLMGLNDERYGPRFPDLSSPYDAALREAALDAARRQGVVAHAGVYAAVLGPNYETRAEYRLLRRLGADAVGMSTVPEAITAAQLGMRVLGLSVISNVGLPDAPSKTTHEEVVAAVDRAAQGVERIVADVLRRTELWEARA